MGFREWSPRSFKAINRADVNYIDMYRFTVSVNPEVVKILIEHCEDVHVAS